MALSALTIDCGSGGIGGDATAAAKQQRPHPFVGGARVQTRTKVLPAMAVWLFHF